MTSPYLAPADLPHPLPSPRVTPRGVATYRDLIERNEQKLMDLRRNRDELLEELSSLDAVIGDVNDTNDRYRMKVLQAEQPADYISRIPLPGTSGEFPAVPGPRGDGHDSGFFSNPRTAVMPPVPADDPTGYCVHCGAPVWRGEDGGLVHGFGNPECNSESEETTVASLGDDADGPKS